MSEPNRTIRKLRKPMTQAQFEQAILKAFGLDGSRCASVTITLRAGQMPVITATLLPDLKTFNTDDLNGVPEYLAANNAKPFLQ